MRALFFLLDADSNASSYHRVVQYLPLFRQRGIAAVLARPAPKAVYRAVMEERRGGLIGKAAFYGVFAATRALQVLRSNTFDVVVIQRDLFPFGAPWLERRLFRMGPRLVYDTDDATYLRPAFTPDTPFQRLRTFDKVEEVVRAARWVSVATEPIAAWARKFNSHVTVVPMAIDPRQYEPRPARTTSTPTLGWAGTAGGLRYLEQLAPVLRDVGLPVRVVSGGYREVRLSVHAEPWRGIEQLREFDIGLLPLDDSEFERAKFPFKLLQYMALGLPVVASRVGIAAQIVEHERNGLLAASQDEWRECLKRLASDEELRERLGQAGRETVLQTYTVERVGPLLADGLLSAARG